MSSFSTWSRSTHGGSVPLQSGPREIRPLCEVGVLLSSAPSWAQHTEKDKCWKCWQVINLTSIKLAWFCPVGCWLWLQNGISTKVGFGSLPVFFSFFFRFKVSTFTDGARDLVNFFSSDMISWGQLFGSGCDGTFTFESSILVSSLLSVILL